MIIKIMRSIQFRNSISFLLLLGILGFQSCSSSKTLRPAKRSVSKTKSDDRSKLAGSRVKILDTANKYIGTRYVYGGKDAKGLDCSGLVSKVFRDNEIDIRGNSTSLSKQGRAKTIETAKIGDLIFFKKGNRVNHVALISEISKNELWVIHSTSSRGVIKEDIFASSYWRNKKYFIKDLL